MEITDIMLTIMVILAMAVGIWAYYKGYAKGYENGKVAMKDRMDREKRRKAKES